MANIPSAASYVNDLEVRFEAAVSEQLFNKIGADINYLLDAKTANDANITTINNRITAVENTSEAAFSTTVNASVSSVGVSAVYSSTVTFAYNHTKYLVILQAPSTTLQTGVQSSIVNTWASGSFCRCAFKLGTNYWWNTEDSVDPANPLSSIINTYKLSSNTVAFYATTSLTNGFGWAFEKQGSAAFATGTTITNLNVRIIPIY
jgi:hypothetical protein